MGKTTAIGRRIVLHRMGTYRLGLSCGILRNIVAIPLQGQSMGTGLRHYIFADDKLIRISQRVRSDFYLKGEAVLKDYAGQIINIVDVFFTTENRKPDYIVRIYGVRHKVNSEGALDEEYDAESMKLLVHALQKPEVRHEGTIADASEKFSEKRLRHKYEWDVPPKVVDMVIKDIFR